MADDGYRLAGLDGERNILQDPFDAVDGGKFSRGRSRRSGPRYGALLLLRQLLVGKPDMAKLDAVRSIAQLRVRRVHYLRRRIQQLEDALAGCHRRLQDVVLVAQVLDGAPEALNTG